LALTCYSQEVPFVALAFVSPAGINALVLAIVGRNKAFVDIFFARVACPASMALAMSRLSEHFAEPVSTGEIIAGQLVFK